MRLNPAAETVEEARLYLRDRTRQWLHLGWYPASRTINIQDKAVILFLRHPEYGLHQAIYILNQYTGQGLYKKVFALHKDIPVVTVEECGIQQYLFKNKIPYRLTYSNLIASSEYRYISDFYGSATAKQSKVPLMNHIDEGLYVLNEIQADPIARLAYIAHPLFQEDALLKINYDGRYVQYGNAKTMILVMEYRNIANQYLSNKCLDVEDIKLSPLPEVNQMLIADKVQNYKDFCLHYDKSHPEYGKLNQYFKNWLERLGVSMEQYHKWAQHMDLSIL